MIKLRCKYCEKQVRIKPLFGTLHICLTPNEIAIKKQREWQIHQQKTYKVRPFKIHADFN